MTVGSILLGIGLLVLVMLVVARPFLLPRLPTAVLPPRLQLQQRKASILAHIKQLEFDVETGKLPESQFQRERHALVLEAAAILQALDEWQEEEDAIETAVSRLRHQQPERTPQVRGTFCPNCGQAVQLGDKFCTHCGHKLVGDA